MIPRGVHRYAQQTFEVIDEPRVELEEIIDAEDGETIVTVQRALGRARHTRLKVDFPWAAVWTVRGGKVVCAQGYRKLGFCFHAKGALRASIAPAPRLPGRRPC